LAILNRFFLELVFGYQEFLQPKFDKLGFAHKHGKALLKIQFVVFAQSAVDDDIDLLLLSRFVTRLPCQAVSQPHRTSQLTNFEHGMSSLSDDVLKEKAPAGDGRGLTDRRQGVGGAGNTFSPNSR
jgi:hypothetical protein